MTSAFGRTYLGRLRELVGDQVKLIAPGVRAIIQDSKGSFLFVRRRDNGSWVMPAGGVELDESIFNCLEREVREETGLTVVSAVPIAVHSHPRFAFRSSTGNEYQMLDLVFWVNEWTGSLLRQTDETTDARFFNLAQLSSVDPLFLETLDDFDSYDGYLILK